MNLTVHGNLTLLGLGKDVNRKRIKRGPGRRSLEGKRPSLAEEINYIQYRAAEHDGRFITIGPLAFFSSGTRDAWMLDPSAKNSVAMPFIGLSSFRARGEPGCCR
jgi:hypothetical protein